MYKHLVIDTGHNNLLASPNLVGMGELVEIYAPDEKCNKLRIMLPRERVAWPYFPLHRKTTAG